MASSEVIEARHDHSAMSGMAIDDDMNVGTINVLWFPQVYWIFVGSVIAAFTAVNLIDKAIARQRLQSITRSGYLAARPKNIFTRSYATLTATFREASNAEVRFLPSRYLQPTVGQASLILANVTLLMVLGFYALSPSAFSDFENTAYRWGFLSMGQLPLIFLLAGKNNVIGWFTGTSYERLNWIHRWVSRTLLLTVTLHMAYWFRDWAPYGNYIGVQIRTDPTTRAGFAAWWVLLWIVFSSFAPIRRWSYEFFIIQHLLSMVAFITLIFLHTPTSDHVWLWPAVAIYLFDRVVRAAYAAYTNFSIFHPAQKRAGTMPGFWASRAELTAMECGVTKVTVRDPPMTWKAGQHAFISCHSISPLQSHPFTISSLPSDGKLEFFVKARKGATAKLLRKAESSLGLQSIEDTTSATVPLALEGPYGRMRPLRQFDSVVLIAGSTGATFTVPLLRELVQQWRSETSCCSTKNNKNFLNTPHGAVTRYITFIWVVKSRTQLSWFAAELAQVLEDVAILRKSGKDVQVDINAYITCDETLTADFAEKPPQPQTQGAARMLSLPSSSSDISASGSDEKKDLLKEGGENIQICEVDSRLESGSEVSSLQQPASNEKKTKLKTCQPDGTCCCRTAITSSASSSSGNANEEIICNCAGCDHPATFSNTSFPSSSTLTTTAATAKAALHPEIRLRSGRPTPRHLILPMLEAAQGESAVVACGPSALNREVRQAVVRLSDERAVHKGTGAQGIWFHGEGFGY